MTLARVLNWTIKFNQAGQQAPATPPKGRKRSRSRSSTPTKLSPKARKNKARRERQKALLARAKGSAPEVKKDVKKIAKDDRVPAEEWKKITSFKYNGKRRCPFFNCSLGCRFGDACRNVHSCVECGGSHPWHGNH